MEKCYKKTLTDFLCEIASGQGVQTFQVPCGAGDNCQERNYHNSVYTLHGQILEVVLSARYLGLTSPATYLGTPT